jgi:5'-phosphate synthase pdxT subunit
MPTVGVLALQGDVREHLRLLADEGVSTIEVKHPAQIEDIDALVIPGGESTTIGKLMTRFGLMEPLTDAIDQGLPMYGTCAGMILLSAQLTEGEQPLMGVLDMVVRRNAFGRQNDSFEAPLAVDGLDEPFPAVFIRAPWVEKVGADIEVLATVDEHPVMVRQGHILATSFHPELTGDGRIHRLLIDLI